MYDFIRQRRLGIIALVATCMLTIAWIRSLIVADRILIEGQFSGPTQKLLFVRSHNSAIRLVSSFQHNRYPVLEREWMVIPYPVIVLPLAMLSLWWLVPPKQPCPKF